LLFIPRGRGRFPVGGGQAADELAIALESLPRLGFPGGELRLLGGQEMPELLESRPEGGLARVPVTLGLQHGLLQFVFARAGPGLDLREALLFAGLVSGADPRLARRVPGGKRLAGRRPRRFGLTVSRCQFLRLPLAHRFAEALFPAPLRMVFRVELLRPGGKSPDRGLEPLQQFECLADAQVATHNPA